MFNEADKVFGQDCTIIINSCDGYEDVWLPFFYSFKEMWPNCSCKIILNTEQKKFSFDGLHIKSLNLSASDAVKPWGWRLRKALSLVETEFVITLFDDFILEAPVDQENLLRCILDMKKRQNVAAYYFVNIPGVNRCKGDVSGFEILGEKDDYRLNSAPAIWRTEKLLGFTGDIDSPWAWEFFGSARTYGTSDIFYCAEIDRENTFVYNYTFGGAIRRGKWVRGVIVPVVKKYNIPLDLEQRGFAGDSLSVGKYSLRWKVGFFWLGFRMVGFKAFIFLYRIFAKKIFKGAFS